MQRLGLDNEGLGEVLAVVGLFNQMNVLADAYQVVTSAENVTYTIFGAGAAGAGAMAMCFLLVYTQLCQTAQASLR